MQVKKGEKKGVLFQECRECGNIFDLNYELEEQEKLEEESIAMLMQAKALAFKQVCWGCRNYQG